MGKGGDMDNNTRWQEFNSIARNRELKPTEKALLLVIFSYNSAQKGYSYPSIETLMLETPIKDKTTFFKNRKSLVEKGYLRIETIKGKECHYFITVPSRETPPSRETIPSSNIIPPPSGESKPPPSRETIPQKEKKKKIKEYIDLSFIDDVIDKVKITKEEYEKLTNKFSREVVNSQILSLDNYISNGKGTKYKDHYKVLNTWCNGIKSKQTPGQISMDGNGIRSFKGD